jgi:hypothetical protein
MLKMSTYLNDIKMPPKRALSKTRHFMDFWYVPFLKSDNHLCLLFVIKKKTVFAFAEDLLLFEAI